MSAAKKITQRRFIKQTYCLTSCLFLAVFFQNCGQGFHVASELTGSSSLSSGGGDRDSLSSKFTCTDPSIRGMSEAGMTRLSKAEYVNTLSDIFGQDVISAVGAIGSFPDRVVKNSVSEFDTSYSQEQASALFNSSFEIARAVFANATFLARVAPTCLQQAANQTTIDRTCAKGWIDSIGLKIYRRPLTSAQSTAYLNLLDSSALSAIPLKAKLEVILSNMLQAPQAVFHWSEVVGTSQKGRAKVDAYTVASRLAYRMTDSGPDSTLLAAAAKGELANADALKAQAHRLLMSDRGRKKVFAMVSHWLHLDATPMPSAKALERFGLNSSEATRTRIREELVAEVLAYVNEIIFERRGTYKDLMLSTLAFPRSAETAKIFGTAIAPAGQSVQSGNGRMGLVTRPALLLSGVDRESPVFRGVVLRSRVLCEPIPSPPADSDGEIADAVASIDLSDYPMRENTRLITEKGACLSCHGFINPIGNSLSSFGPLGEFRTEERTYTAAGQLKHTFPINSAVKDARILGDNDALRGHEDLATLIAGSSKGQSCFVRYTFQWSRMRKEQASDNCALAEAEKTVSSDLSLVEAIVQNVATEDIYWKKF